MATVTQKKEVNVSCEGTLANPARACGYREEVKNDNLVPIQMVESRILTGAEMIKSITGLLKSDQTASFKIESKFAPALARNVEIAKTDKGFTVKETGTGTESFYELDAKGKILKATFTILGTPGYFDESGLYHLPKVPHTSKLDANHNTTQVNLSKVLLSCEKHGKKIEPSPDKK